MPSAPATKRPEGTMLHAIMAQTPATIAMASKRPKGTGSRPGSRRASQLRVKLGTIRPPITQTSVTTRPMPARYEYSAIPSKCASMWNAMLATASSEMMPTTFRLFHLRPATISRAAAAASSSRKAASIASANCQPMTAGEHVASLPGKPSGEQGRERGALDGKPAGPVRHRGQEEACDHSADIAEQHLMDVPVPRRKGGRQRDIASEHASQSGTIAPA